jgi:hypothetical protein
MGMQHAFVHDSAQLGDWVCTYPNWEAGSTTGAGLTKPVGTGPIPGGTGPIPKPVWFPSLN